MLSRADFWPYQESMYQMAMNPVADDTRSLALWVGMGGGKTAVGLTVAEDMLRYAEARRVLIVSTAKAAEHTWQHEHTEWAHLAHQSDYTTFLCGSPKERQAKLDKGVIHIVSQENARWLAKGYGTSWPYDLVVIDDCKGLKTPGSETFKRFRSILPFTTKVLVLSGTPMPNGYIQLWPQVYLIDQGKRLGKTHSAYKSLWFDPDWNGYNWSLKMGAEDEIKAALTDIAYSVDPKDYLECQVPDEVKVPVYLPPALRAQYKKLEKEYFLALGGGDTVEALSEAVLQNKLAQFCNGAVYTDPMNDKSEYTEIHNLKINALEDIVREQSGENLLVAYQYQSDWFRIKKRFPYALHANDKGAIDAWKKGRVPMMCCHPGSGGHGLNLHTGGRTIVWFGSEWSLELNQQMDERIGAVRQAQSGQNWTPRYIRIYVDQSVEQRIANALAEKDQTQESLKQHVRMKI